MTPTALKRDPRNNCDMSQITSHRLFEPGTTGWTVDDLADSDIAWEWDQGRYELVEGVLTKMAPQGIHTIKPLHRLRRMIERRLDESKAVSGEFFTEVDLLLRPNRVPRPDMLFLTADQLQRQERLESDRNIAEADYCPVLIMPLVILESVSVGHEEHDRVTKRGWYAKAKIPHYWILTAHERSLVCLKLKGASYIEEAAGRNDQDIRSSAFGGIVLPLAELWRKAGPSRL